MAKSLLDGIGRLFKKACLKDPSSTRVGVGGPRIQAYPYVPIPGPAEFRAVLATEQYRAETSKRNLTVLYIDVMDWSPERVEEVGVFLRGVTKPPETVFISSPNCFAMVLRNMGTMDAKSVSSELLKLLQKRFPKVVVRIEVAPAHEVRKILGEFDSVETVYAGPPSRFRRNDC